MITAYYAVGVPCDNDSSKRTIKTGENQMYKWTESCVPREFIKKAKDKFYMLLEGAPESIPKNEVYGMFCEALVMALLED